MQYKFTTEDHRKGAEAVNNSLTAKQRSAKAKAAAKKRWERARKTPRSEAAA